MWALAFRFGCKGKLWMGFCEFSLTRYLFVTLLFIAQYCVLMCNIVSVKTNNAPSVNGRPYMLAWLSVQHSKVFQAENNGDFLT